MKNKIIFLDIDGVLNVIPHDWDDFGAIFHKQYMENLRHIIDKTGAKIIISSTWKGDGLNVLQNMWRIRKYAGEVIDITPFANEVVYHTKLEFYDEVDRGHEIQLWLDRHPDITEYVILDDDTDMLKSQKKHFVRCSRNTKHPDCVDIGYGLTKQCSEKAIKILNKNT